MNPLGDVLKQDGLAGARRCDDQPALAKADGRKNVDHPRGQLGRVVLELQHRLRIHRRPLVEADAIHIVAGRPPLDCGDPLRVLSLGGSAQQQPRAQPHLADHLLGHDDAHRLEWMAEIAQLPIVPLVADL